MQSDNEQHTKKDFVFLPYRTKATVNCMEASLLEGIRSRANALGYDQPMIRENDSGEKEIVLYPKRSGIRIGAIDLQNISINLSELPETGEVSVCCWESLSGIISFFIVLAWFLAVDIFVIFKSYAQWKQLVPFYIVLAAANIVLFLIFYYRNRAIAKRVLNTLLRDIGTHGVSRGRFS